jgi:hypothetical protein
MKILKNELLNKKVSDVSVEVIKVFFLLLFLSKGLIQFDGYDVGARFPNKITMIDNTVLA